MSTTESAAAAAAKGLPAGWSAEKSVSGRWSYSCGSESFSSLARALRFRAALLEARLVDPLWRETAAELLWLPQAA